LVDLEEGVIGGVERGPFSELFAENQKITSQSGAGNNWAVGHEYYGPLYRERLLDAVRIQAEYCDALQSFFICHSMGGGTGSGLGTYILEMLEDEFPDVYRFCNVVFPSADDDVVTSPYNSLLALNKLTEHADCVLPMENQALLDITHRIQSAAKTMKKGTGIHDQYSSKAAKQRAFDTMNNIVANVMLNMTSSMRFEGSLNIDINEISMNLVPFPRLKYLLSSLTPLYHLADVKLPERKLDQMFLDAFSRESQLIKADPRNSTYLACALILRGEVELSDVRRNIEKLKNQVRFIPWNREGWKTGLCSFPPVNQVLLLILRCTDYTSGIIALLALDARK
jgi:tubulin epsilon